MTTLVLSLLALLLAGPVPFLLARATWLRRVPRAAITLWQAVALAAVLAALGAGLSLVTSSADRLGTDPLWWGVSALALVLTGVVMVRILLSGHRVGTGIRASRRRHRELVDLVSAPPLSTPKGTSVRVLDHAVPVAYCLPDASRPRVVLSSGAIGRLSRSEMDAVLAHECAHLRARHDLVLEAFTVLHAAFPSFASSRAALAEVRLLVEVLADRAARRGVGRLAVARALVALADSRTPDAALGASGGDLRARIELLDDDRPHLLLAAATYATAVATVTLPTACVALPWLSGLV